MAAKKSAPKGSSNKNPNKDYTTGIVWMNIDPAPKKSAGSKKTTKKK